MRLPAARYYLARAIAPRTLVLVGDIAPEAVRALPGVTDVAVEPLEGRRRISAALAADSNGPAPLQAAFALGALSGGRVEPRKILHRLLRRES